MIEDDCIFGFSLLPTPPWVENPLKILTQANGSKFWDADRSGGTETNWGPVPDTQVPQDMDIMDGSYLKKK